VCPASPPFSRPERERFSSNWLTTNMDLSQEMSCELCSHPNFLQGARVGGAGDSPAVLRRDEDAKIASGTLAPPNPAVRSKVWDHQSNYTNRGEKCGLRCDHQLILHVGRL